MPPWNDFLVLLRAESYFFITISFYGKETERKQSFLFPLCSRLNVHMVKDKMEFWKEVFQLYPFLSLFLTAHVLFSAAFHHPQLNCRKMCQTTKLVTFERNGH